MSLSKKPYKGCRDFFPADMRVRDFLFNHMRRTAESFGFEGYDGPLLEEVELYKAKSGEELINDQIYSFEDRGNRFVAIRPEMTPTVARMVSAVHKEVAKPLRWYSIPNLMRYEKPQRGRVREHWQFNVDIFGAPEGLGELEVLQLIVNFLTKLGATEEMFQILLNDRSIVDAVFNHLLKLDDEKSYKLYKIIDKAKKVTAEKLDTMVGEVLTSTNDQKLFADYLALKTNSEVEVFLTKHNLQDSCESYLKLSSLIEELNLTSFVKYDPTIVRGLDYYTGMVFEIFDLHPDNNRAIAGGGAYANLLKIFNEKPLQGIGFGLGDVTLRDFLETHNLLPDLTKPDIDLFITYTDESSQVTALRLANELRANTKLKVELNLGKIKFGKIFKLAGSKSHNYVGIIGENEITNNEVQVKNLKTREAQNIKLNDYMAIEAFITKE